MYSFTATAEREIAGDVKQNLSYIGLDYDSGHISISEFDKKKTYELPDRNIISVGSKRFYCVEVLFQPSFTGKKSQSSPQHSIATLLSSVMKCDLNIRKEI